MIHNAMKDKSLPVLFQRAEGAALLAAGAAIYHMRGGNWLIAVLVFFAIDLSMIGYLANPKVGSWVYNLGHTLATPIVLYFIARAADSSALTLLALIWLMHIGIDRLMGYGLKYPDSFQHTHLGKIGKNK
jgi:hypothetical protein